MRLTAYLSPIPLATCEPTCENGGSCFSGNRCSCLPAYRGHRCQYRKFSNFLVYLYNVQTVLFVCEKTIFAATRDCSPEAQGFTGVFNCTNYEKENRYCMLLCIIRQSTDHKTRKSRIVFVLSIRAPTTRQEKISPELYQQDRKRLPNSQHQSTNQKTGKGCLIWRIRAPTTRQENIALVGSIRAPTTRQEKVALYAASEHQSQDRKSLHYAEHQSTNQKTGKAGITIYGTPQN